MTSQRALVTSSHKLFFKMASPQIRCAKVVKLYYTSRSPITVIREMQTLYPEEERFTRQQVHRIVRRFEQTGSVIDGRQKNSGRPRSARSSENVHDVKETIEETPQVSIRKVLGNITNHTSKSSVHRMLRFDLKLFPYTLSIMQHLKETDIESRLLFAQWMKGHADITYLIWFSDEAHFYLNAQVNKQNFRYWGSEKPNMYLEKPLHSKKVTVWAALSSQGIIGPFFYEDENGETATVNSDRYLKLLKTTFLPAL